MKIFLKVLEGSLHVWTLSADSISVLVYYVKLHLIQHHIAHRE